MAATIRIAGAEATLSGIKSPSARLKDCLSFLHPGRFYSKAFRDKRWDGRVALAKGHTFPAGFALRVKDFIEREGFRCSISSKGGSRFPVELVPEDYLHGITLRDYQLEAIAAMLSSPRGALKEPTGSGKTAMMAAAARAFWEEKGWPSLIVVPKKGLAVQTRAAFEHFYNGDITVGIAGDGQREDGPVTVATAQTLINFKDHTVKGRGRVRGDAWLRDLIKQTRVLFLDECHRAKSPSWYEIAMACPAFRRYGLSGTPIVEEELDDLKLEGATGPIIHETEAERLIDSGVAARPKIAMVMSDAASGPELPKIPKERKLPSGKLSKKLIKMDYKTAYRRGVVESEHHNRTVVASARWMIQRKRKVLILCRLKDHFMALHEALQDANVEHAALWGDTVTDEREEAKLAFKHGEISCILATTIFDEGEDIGGVGGIVLAEGVKALTSNLQRIGRGMRGDTDDVWVVDIVPTCHETLTDHALKRCEDYENAGYEVVVVEEWPGRKMLRKLPRDLLPFEHWDAALQRLSEAV